MAAPKVFVSSTCHDLKAIRSDLRDFILGYGFEPIMSDFGDIHYDPEQNTHESCLEAIEDSDLVIFLVGSRFGSSSETLQTTKEEKVKNQKQFFSITQEEVKRAQDKGIYVYTFIERGVYHDYWVYKSNQRSKSNLTYPSIQTQEHSKYIFDFIDSINKKNNNNAIFEFDTPINIKKNLVSQWGQLFKKLLSERKDYKTKDEFSYDLSQELQNIKDAIIEANSLNNKAKTDINNFINHKMLITFCYTLDPEKYESALKKESTWHGLLVALGVVEVRSNEYIRRHFYFNMSNNTYYRSNHSINYLNEIKIKWVNFKGLTIHSKKKIIESIPQEALENNNSALTKEQGHFKNGDNVTESFLKEEVMSGY